MMKCIDNMRLHRFYIEKKLVSLQSPYLDGRQLMVRVDDEGLLHQMRDVFRLKKDDEVIFFDGEGMDITFRIEMLSKKEGIFVKEKEERSAGHGNTRRSYITLIMALIKKDNFELVLQKCTELGVSRFVPVLAERSEKKNIDMERAKRIIKEASEQCGRGDIPTIGEIKKLDEILGEENLIVFDASGTLSFACLTARQGEGWGEVNISKKSSRSDLKHLNPKVRPLGFAILIGPEGGWSEREIKMFQDRKIPIYKLGELTLRAETAAIVASARVMHL